MSEGRAADAGTAAVDALIGTTVGDFDVERLLGQGGMGRVYKAHQRSLGRPVALKVLSPGLLHSERVQQRFAREARAAAKLSHPGIVALHQVYTVGQVQMLVLAYVDAVDLAVIRSGDAAELSSEQRALAPVPSTPEEFRRIARLVRDVLLALDHAHEHGILHRDVKPHNILIDRDGRPHVTDFGLAKDLHDASISREGDLAGTYAYMSPEQALSKRVRVDRRTDVFSAGVVLYELLTGTRPFDGTTSQELLYSIAFKDPYPIHKARPELPAELATICLTALEKAPDDRFRTAAAMAADLQRFLDDEPIHSRQTSWTRRTWRAVVRNRAGMAIALAGTLVGVGASVLFLTRDDPLTAAHPRIRVSADVDGATVLALPIDEIRRTTGPMTELGKTGRVETGFALPPATYRIVVRTADGYAELYRVLAPLTTDALRAKIRPTASVTQDMVRIPEGQFVFGSDADGTDPFYKTEKLHLPAFWIDRDEVTVGQYAEFCRQTKRVFPFGVVSDEHARRPMVGIRWESARSYAEWAGKRLPTVHEWQKAARGTTGARWPAGLTRDNMADHVIVNRIAEMRPASQHEMFLFAMQRLEGLEQRLLDRSSFGLTNVLGSAREWTESPYVRWMASDWVASPESRAIVGGGWNSYVDDDRTDLRYVESCQASGGDFELGFRCAKSIID